MSLWCQISLPTPTKKKEEKKRRSAENSVVFSDICDLDRNTWTPLVMPSWCEFKRNFSFATWQFVFFFIGFVYRCLWSSNAKHSFLVANWTVAGAVDSSSFFFLPNGFVNVGHSITLLLSLQSMKNFGLDHVMRIYLKGLSTENPQAAAEVNTSV